MKILKSLKIKIWIVLNQKIVKTRYKNTKRIFAKMFTGNFYTLKIVKNLLYLK